MAQAGDPIPDEDLRARFRWRWGEHGIYLGVCSFIGLCVLGLHFVPGPPKRAFDPANFDFIHVRYVAVADEPIDDPFKANPFRDPRLIRPLAKHPR
jgi:hypothetical protein